MPLPRFRLRVPTRSRVALGVAAVALAALVPALAAAPASAAAATPTPAGAPAPICTPSTLSPTGQLCIPQNWMTLKNVITNDGLVELNSVSQTNSNSQDSEDLTRTILVSGTLTAGISGDVKFGGNDIAGTITPSASASVTASTSITGQASIPPDCDGTLYFGIKYAMANVYVSSRDLFGRVTTTEQLAWAPIDPDFSTKFDVPIPPLVTPANTQCVASAAAQPMVTSLLEFFLTAPFGKVPANSY